ncbi:MAG: GTPase domain-containing protein [Bryobacterales bacterium]|nr:GTPase domain-containing protein [Bryobacterales bacterium]
MPTLDLGATEAKAAIALLKLAYRQGWLDRLVTLLRKKHHILVLGCSGAGKTAFLDSLAASIPSAIDRMNRTEFAQKHSIRIAKVPFVFHDTPGQTLHHSRRMQAVREAMKGSIAGIINVVSYGYHESRVDREVATIGGKVNEEYLAQRRLQEIDALYEWTALLGDNGTVGWLMTVVTTADLWWDRRETVLDHYSAGPYSTALEPARSLRPVIVEYCSVFQKFYGEAPMCGDFQDADRSRAKGHLLSQLLVAVGRAQK